MRLFVVGVNSPTGKDLIEILRKRKIRFMAPADKHFDPDNFDLIARMVADYAPDQLINLADFISGNHSALARAEKVEQRCYRVNARLPAALAEICGTQQIPMLHLSNAYVFDGLKKLGYNENDEANPKGVYGAASIVGETAVREHSEHIILRSGWLFGKHKKGLIRSWLKRVKAYDGQLEVSKRRFSPTHTGDLAAAVLAIAQQVDCDANVWGTYHYSGLETKREVEFVEQVIKYAANHDEAIYQLLDNKRISEKDVRPPEIMNATLSSKKIFDTFGIKQKSWHGHLQDVIKALYQPDTRRKRQQAAANEETSSVV